jgi:conjugative relaxase-like TrwC/TraI family protein
MWSLPRRNTNSPTRADTSRNTSASAITTKEGQRVTGEWQGLGAAHLGLFGRVRADDFLRLCENQQPATGNTLTQRLNTTRVAAGKEAANRRIFYDFTFSPPKSVSLVGFLGGDTRVLEAHARAVKAALREFEAFASTRLRGGGVQTDRPTGNFAAALFTHDTSRALDPQASRMATRTELGWSGSPKKKRSSRS